MSHDEREHSKLGGSGVSRWSLCPGSVALCERAGEREAKEYTAEGTAAHELAEHCFTQNIKDAKECKGMTFTSDGFTFEVDNEMAEAVQVYLDEVRGVAKVSQDLHVEAAFDLEWLQPGMYGTNDACYYDFEQRILYVWDLKYGKGLLVDHIGNMQLRYYGLGALYGFEDKIDEVVLTIVQPRIYHDDGDVRADVISAQDLLSWGACVLRPAAVATRESDAPLRTGKQCQFCDAGAVCPEKLKQVQLVAKTDFNDVELANPDLMSVEDKLKVANFLGALEPWRKQVMASLQCDAENGQYIPGHKLVKAKSNRRWINKAQAEAWLTEQLGDEAYTRKYLTITQAEKLLDKNAVNEHAEKPDNGLSLVAETDRRQAVAPTVVTDFIDSSDFLQ